MQFSYIYLSMIVLHMSLCVNENNVKYNYTCDLWWYNLWRFDFVVLVLQSVDYVVVVEIGVYAY